MRNFWSLKILVLSLITTFSAAPLAAQTSESDLAARLVKKVLFLRGMWGEDRLEFDADGKPEKTYPVLPFTEDGFEVKSVKRRSDGLRLEGQRQALEFDPDGKMRIVSFKTKGSNGHMTIDVHDGPGTNFDPGLAAIFAPDLASLTPSLPSYWQYYARKNFLSSETSAAPPSVMLRMIETASEATEIPTITGKAAHVGGQVKPPKLLNSGDPQFSDVARELKFSGNVQVYLWVDRTGSVSHIKIMKPVGLGLDEAAIAAVQRYKFAPATRDGDPVTVDLYIDVNFQIF